jgi:hypothetical protein
MWRQAGAITVERQQADFTPLSGTDRRYESASWLIRLIAYAGNRDPQVRGLYLRLRRAMLNGRKTG